MNAFLENAEREDYGILPEKRPRGAKKRKH
jgi:hypothetical protein